MDHSQLRDLVSYQVDRKAQEPYVVFYKNDKTNPHLSKDYKVWRSIDVLEKAAQTFHPDFKNFWKWVKKTFPDKSDEKSLRQHLYNLVYFLIYDVTEEMEKWKQHLLKGDFWYYPTCF